MTGSKEWQEPRNTINPVKTKKIVKINSIVIIYAIGAILLGICLIAGSIYAKGKINETVKANAKPTVEINRNDDTNTIDIEVSHIRGIKEIRYKWNNEAEEIINGNNQKTIKQTIPLIGGQNTLTVSVTEENGQTVSYKNTYTVANLPEIELSSVSNGIKITVSSKENLSTVKYKWDDGEEQNIDVTENQYEGIINAPGGKHTLEVEAIDTKGNKGLKTQAVVGDTAPTVTIKAQIIDGKKMFVIDAEDDIGISNVEITLNDNVIEQADVNDKTYHKEVEILTGENKILVKAYNVNNLEAKKGAKYNN